jgi:hypothetical protein
MTPQPPVWAQTLVSLLVPARDRDSISGDLLEEYRETIVPQRGSLAANVWYLRQVAGFVWRACLPFAVALGVTLAVRDVVDATIPTTDNYHFRAAVTTYFAFGTYSFAGLSLGWRTDRTLSGSVVASAATIVAIAIAIAAPLAMTALLSTGVIDRLPSYEGLREGFDVPIVPMLVVGGIFGTLGAAIGKALRRIPRIDLI